MKQFFSAYTATETCVSLWLSWETMSKQVRDNDGCVCVCATTFSCRLFFSSFWFHFWFPSLCRMHGLCCSLYVRLPATTAYRVFYHRLFKKEQNINHFNWSLPFSCNGDTNVEHKSTQHFSMGHSISDDDGAHTAHAHITPQFFFFSFVWIFNKCLNGDKNRDRWTTLSWLV